MTCPKLHTWNTKGVNTLSTAIALHIADSRLHALVGWCFYRRQSSSVASRNFCVLALRNIRQHAESCHMLSQPVVRSDSADAVI